MFKINNVIHSTPGQPPANPRPTSNAQMPVDVPSAVSSLYELYNQMPKVIEESQAGYIQKDENAENVGKPSLWQQLKTKAQNITKSASDLIKRHPQTVKTALVATAAAVVAGVVVATKSALTSSISTLTTSASQRVDDNGATCVESDKEYSYLLPKPITRKEALILAEPKPGSKLSDLASKRFQFLLAGVNAKRSDKEGITGPAFSIENMRQFVLNNHRSIPVAVCVSIVAFYVIKKGISSFLKSKPILQPVVPPPVTSFALKREAAAYNNDIKKDLSWFDDGFGQVEKKGTSRERGKGVHFGNCNAPPSD